VTQTCARARVRRQVVPVYAAGFVTAFGAHAVAANLGRYTLARHGSLWELGRLGALAVVLMICAALVAPRERASPSHPGPGRGEHQPARPPFPHPRGGRSG